jgi:hypothetical protein
MPRQASPAASCRSCRTLDPLTATPTMDRLVFHTAVPFGYLLFALVLVALMALAGTLLAAYFFTKPRKFGLAATGGALLALVVAIAAANLNQEEIDFNPLVRERLELAGAWRNDASRLDLLSDGRYKCDGDACANLGSNGSWQREGDFFLVLRPVTGPNARWRLAVRGEHLWLAAGNFQSDPDLWQPKFTFEQSAPWPNRSFEATAVGKPPSAPQLQR